MQVGQFTVRVLISLGILLLSWASSQINQVKLPNSLSLKDEKGIALKDSNGNDLSVTSTQPQSELVIDSSTTLCLTDAFETPGQAWRVNISAGGVTLLAGGKPKVTPYDRGTALGLGQGLASPQQVSVLVIDKFQRTTFPLQETTGLLLQLSLNHGALVVAHLKEILRAASNNKVHVETLPIDQLPSTEEYGQVTTTALLDKLKVVLGKPEMNADRPLVINMSIAILPCRLQSRYFELADAAEHLNPPRRLPFRQFLDEIGTLNGHPNDEGYIRSIIAPSGFQDPLSKWLMEQRQVWAKQGHPFLVVAASGNYALTFQTMPAAWPGVVGVAASSVLKPAIKTDWSDVGDVLDIGEWYTFGNAILNPAFQNIVTATGTNGSGTPRPFLVKQNDFAYRGTSFAAPTVTAALAVTISKYPSSPCFNPQTGVFGGSISPASTVPGNSRFAALVQTCR